MYDTLCVWKNYILVTKCIHERTWSMSKVNKGQTIMAHPCLWSPKCGVRLIERCCAQTWPSFVVAIRFGCPRWTVSLLALWGPLRSDPGSITLSGFSIIHMRTLMGSEGCFSQRSYALLRQMFCTSEGNKNVSWVTCPLDIASSLTSVVCYCIICDGDRPNACSWAIFNFNSPDIADPSA